MDIKYSLCCNQQCGNMVIIMNNAYYIQGLLQNNLLKLYSLQHSQRNLGLLDLLQTIKLLGRLRGPHDNIILQCDPESGLW